MCNSDDSVQVLLLLDYSTLERYWRVYVEQGVVQRVQALESNDGAVVQGILEQRMLNGRMTIMGYLSTSRLNIGSGVPDYSKNLQIIANDRLLGDGLAVPKLDFQKNFLVRSISVEVVDGWSFHAKYRSPWMRELFRRFNFWGTLEYDPADFIERFIEIISLHRPQWLIQERRER